MQNTQNRPNPELVAIMLAHALEFAQNSAVVGQEVDSRGKAPLSAAPLSALQTSPQIEERDLGREMAAAG